MKNNILKVAFIVGLTSFGLLACNETPSDKEVKVGEAQENLDEAQQNFEQATTDSINDYATYKQESEAKLNANDQKIADLKLKMTSEKKDMKIKYDKKIGELETKNNEIRTRLNDYKEEDQTSWTSFKKTMNEEMDEIGKSISEMAQKNLEKAE